VRAEREARAARRGIWSADAPGYGDYEERKRWWDARADFIRAFERAGEGRSDHIVLTRGYAIATLERLRGREASVLGLVARVVDGRRGPARAVLSGARHGDLTVVFAE